MPNFGGRGGRGGRHEVPGRFGRRGHVPKDRRHARSLLLKEGSPQIATPPIPKAHPLRSLKDEENTRSLKRSQGSKERGKGKKREKCKKGGKCKREKGGKRGKCKKRRKGGKCKQKKRRRRRKIFRRGQRKAIQLLIQELGAIEEKFQEEDGSSSV